MQNPVRIGVVGLGPRGLYLAGMFAGRPGAAVRAVADPRDDQIAIARTKFGDDFHYFASGEEMATSGAVDAVVVATGDRFHAANGLEALRAGRHVLIEKPLAQSLQDCDEIVRQHIATQKVAMTYLELRYSAFYQRIKQMIDTGDIGRPILAEVADNCGRVLNTFYHRRNARRAEVIFSLPLQKGVHTLDLMNWFMGGHPRKVFALGGRDFFGGDEPNDKRCTNCEQASSCRFFTDSSYNPVGYPDVTMTIDNFCVWARECDVDDNTVIAVDYDNGARASYIESQFAPEYSREFKIMGDEGKITAVSNEFTGETLLRLHRRYTAQAQEFSGATVEGHGGGDDRLADDFISAICDGHHPLSDVIAGRDSAAIAIAAEESVKSGEAIAIPSPPTTA
jgi:predicted dehydrogenase